MEHDSDDFGVWAPTPQPRLRATVIRVMLAGLVLAAVVGVGLASNH